MDSKTLATLAFLDAFGAEQSLLTYFADLSGPASWYPNNVPETGHRIESGPDSGVGTPDCLFFPNVWKFAPTLRGSLENITHICRVWKKGVLVFPTRLRFPTARLLGTVWIPDCRMPDCFPDSILWPAYIQVLIDAHTLYSQPV